jgi:hypothetical protein
MGLPCSFGRAKLLLTVVPKAYCRLDHDCQVTNAPRALTFLFTTVSTSEDVRLMQDTIAAFFSLL